MVAFDAALPRGTCPIQQFGLLADRGRPLVILFMDAFGPRPALYTTAERLAVTGYRVLLPDLFYEHLPFAPLAPQSVFSGGDDLGRLMAMFGAINQSMIDADVHALLSFADEHLNRSTDRGGRLLHGGPICAHGSHRQSSCCAGCLDARQQSGAGER